MYKLGGGVDDFHAPTIFVASLGSIEGFSTHSRAGAGERKHVYTPGMLAQ